MARHLKRKSIKGYIEVENLFVELVENQMEARREYLLGSDKSAIVKLNDMINISKKAMSAIEKYRPIEKFEFHKNLKENFA